MLRTTVLCLASLAAAGAASAEDAPQDTVNVHGKALALSCAEWSRNPDGSWTSTGPLLVGTEIVKNATVRGKDAKALETKCLNGATPSAAAPPQDDTKKHKRQRGSTEPSGT